MSNKPHHRPQRQPIDTIDQYARALVRLGRPDREVSRAALYAERYGLEALEGDGGDRCIGFDVPDCENWNCLNPEHQRLSYTPPSVPDWDILERTYPG